MKKYNLSFLITCLTLFYSLAVLAQNNTGIKGKIQTADGQPANNVTITIKALNISTNSDESGQYKINNIKAGNYTVKISAVGHAAQEKRVTVAENTIQMLNFSIKTSLEELNEVVISSSGNKFTKHETPFVSRMPLKDIENSQTYSTITGELLKEQVVTNFDDALKNAPGISKLWESTGRGGDGSSYYSLRGFPVQPTMVNGLPGLTNGGQDPANIERIEVIKGPSGTLFGSSLISYGGLINVATKRPYDHFGAEVGYTVGTYGLNRATVDVNTPLNLKKSLNFRINSAFHTQNSFQDAGFKESFFIAPSLSYQATDRLSFIINTEIMKSEGTNPTMLFLDRNAPLRVKNIKELGYDHKRSYTSNDITIKTPTFNLQGQVNYKLSDEWTSQTVYSRSESKSQGLYSYLYESTQYVPAITEGVVLGRFINNQNTSTLTNDIQQNFIGDFKIGNLRNRMVVGLDYFSRNSLNRGSGYVGNGSVYIGNASLQTVNENVFGITNPNNYILNNDNGNMTAVGSYALLAGAPVSNIKTKEEVFSAYASDVLNITPALSAMASIRVDRFMNKGDISTDDDNYNQTAFSPKFGLVYQPILDKVSIFANYMNGFKNLAPGTDKVNGELISRTYSPEQANQIEFGTKLNLFNNKLTASLSYYDIKVRNTVYTLLDGPTEISYQNGAQRNKGFETEIVANPVPGLNIIAGYSYNDSRLTEGDVDFVGKRPESAGPQNMANLWVSYKFNQGALNGFGLGFGGNYASENKIMNRVIAGTFTLPSYTVMNTSLFYNAKKFSVSVKLDNIANKQYYNGWSTINPQNLRNLAASFAYKF
ncbi:TonB-dependent receptor [Flavobacterium sp. '19STA2R22 D10 B1']|uniref:TonB-dependent receptor n=1 Tax=Flavobacterium aerium TaxID=3037261 RepID=UPI00278BFD79|nr:TonB-dependent receptor [Flavobacterium sp. '19STA2R22 D10 B1']